ncbi:MAG: ABC transporter ATP-binding protein [Bacteroidales bacterium]|nr:ABC transporter ATP-binding protein [Bacteroidales bacterium]
MIFNNIKIKLFLKFYTFLKPYKAALIFILLLSLITIAINILNPYLLKILVDDALMQKNKQLLVKLLILMVALGFFSTGIEFLSTYFNGLITGKIMINIRKSIFTHIIYLPQSFFLKNKIGDIVQRANNEVDNLRDFITNSLLRVIKDFIMIIGYTSALCWLNARLFLLISITLPLTIVTLRYFQPRIKKTLEQIRRKDSEILGFFIERFNSIKLIQAFNIYEEENNKLQSQLTSRFDLGMRRIKLIAFNSAIMGLVFSTVVIILFSYGGYLIINNLLTIGSLLAFLSYLLNIMSPVKDLQNLYMDVIRVSVSMERINEILATETIQKKTDSVCPFEFKDKIHFDQVSFNYNESNIIKNLNVSFIKGKTYAIVGNNGSGKSTLVNLLLRFFDPLEGSIYIDTVPIQKFDIFQLREKICYISQENYLFNDSIFENIRVGKINCSEEELIEATKKVNIYSLITSLDEEFKSRVGDQGTKLSGGEKQRIALARAFIKNADIIILDEAFASLDSESEKEILVTLKEKKKDVTIIIISHRASTIKEVDEVVYINNGTVVEQGKHEELMLKKGYYWNLFKEQMEISLV